MGWDPKDQQAVVQKDGRTLILRIGGEFAVIEGEEVPLDAPVRILSGRTVIPARFFATAFRGQVSWDPESRSVLVTSRLRDRDEFEWHGFYAIRSYPSFMARYQLLAEISTSWFTLKETGEIERSMPTGYEQVPDIAREEGIRTYAYIFRNDPGVIWKFLENDKAWEETPDDLLDILTAKV